MAGEAGDEELAADGIRRFAVHAGTRFGAGGIQTEALGVDGSRHITGTLHGAVPVIADLVHADDHDHLPRTLCYRADPVGIAVNIDHDAVLRYRIGGGKEHIRVISRKHGSPFVFIGIPVNKVVISIFQCLHKPDLVYAHPAAHGDGAAFRDQRQCDFFRLFF